MEGGEREGKVERTDLLNGDRQTSVRTHQLGAGILQQYV